MGIGVINPLISDLTLSLSPALSLLPVALSLPLSHHHEPPHHHHTPATPTSAQSPRQHGRLLRWPEPPRNGRKQPTKAAQICPNSPKWFLTWKHVEMMSKLRYGHTIGKPMEKRNFWHRNQPIWTSGTPAIGGQSHQIAAAAVPAPTTILPAANGGATYWIWKLSQRRSRRRLNGGERTADAPSRAAGVAGASLTPPPRAR